MVLATEVDPSGEVDAVRIAGGGKREAGGERWEGERPGGVKGRGDMIGIARLIAPQ